jgi:hypothetical protein
MAKAVRMLFCALPSVRQSPMIKNRPTDLFKGIGYIKTCVGSRLKDISVHATFLVYKVKKIKKMLADSDMEKRNVAPCEISVYINIRFKPADS